MRPRTFRLTEPQANEVQAAYRHGQHAHTKTRFQAVRLYGRGYRGAQIIDSCAGSPRSRLQGTRADKERGRSARIEQRLGAKRARRRPEQIEALQNQLHRYPPAQRRGGDACRAEGQLWSVVALAQRVQRDDGLLYQSPTSDRTRRQKCDLSYQRPAKGYTSHHDFKVIEFEERLENNA